MNTMYEENEFYNALSDKLIAIRKKRKIKQKDMAELIGVSQPFLGNIEKQREKASAYRLNQILIKAGYPSLLEMIDNLLAFDDDDTPDQPANGSGSTLIDLGDPDLQHYLDQEPNGAAQEGFKRVIQTFFAALKHAVQDGNEAQYQAEQQILEQAQEMADQRRAALQHATGTQQQTT